MRRALLALCGRPPLRMKTYNIVWPILVGCLVLCAAQELRAQSRGWVARYDGPGNTDDQANALAVDDSGNVYVTGSSWGVGTSVDYATIKYNSNGDTVWVRRYDGPVTGVDQACAIAVDDSGNVYVTGTSFGTGVDWDYATIKYNNSGDTAWVRRYQGLGGGNDVAASLAVDDSGNAYVTGYSLAIALNDYVTIKYNGMGDTLWVRVYTAPGSFEDLPWALTVDDSGNVYVTGQSFGSNDDYATVKYNSIGDTLWVRRYDGSGNLADRARAVAVDDAGNVYVTGESWGVGTLYDYATIKYSSTGDTVWVRRYDGPGSLRDGASAVAVDDSGNVYVTGISWSGASDDYATIKYNSTGDILWVRRYNGPGNGGDVANDLTVDASGNVYVAGQSGGAPTSEDYAILKYDSNGDIVWVRRYDGPADNTDRAYALAVDDSGNVYVTGDSRGVGTDEDYATIKNCPVDVLTLSLPSPPDTVFTDSTYSPQAWVQSAGVCTPGSFDVMATIDGYADTVQVTNLASGDSALVTFAPWTVPAVDSSLYTMIVCARESGDEDTTNDCAQKSIFAYTAVAVHDGGVVSLDAPSDTVFTGFDYTPMATVANFGNRTETFDVACDIDGWEDTVLVIDLAPDDSAQVNFALWTVPWADSTTYTMCAQTWVAGDNDPGNDTLCKAVFAYNPRDVGADTILSPPDTALIGQSCAVIVEVTNYGEVTDTFWVTCQIDPVYFNSAQVSGLAPSASAPCTLPDWTVTAGPWVALAWTTLGYDRNPANDHTYKNIITGVEELTQVPIPQVFRLSQSRPNPFTHTTTIRYSLPDRRYQMPDARRKTPDTRRTTLSVYDLGGRLVTTLVDEAQEPGYYTIVWDGRDDNGAEVLSGMYFYRLEAADFRSTKKMILLR